MRTILQALLGLILWAPVVRGAEPVDTKAIDAIVQEAMKSWQVPGAAVAVVRGDEVIYMKPYGVRAAGGTDHVTADTLFAIGSCTKAFTACAAGVLVDDGKMSWDDPVRKHLNWFRLADPLADRDVTLRDQLCHRTGLAGHDILWFGTTLGRDGIVKCMAHVGPAHAFRTTFAYNNIMYLAAGQAVGAAAGTSWDEVVARRLFDPLGMHVSTCSIKSAQANPNHALPHRVGDDGAVEALPWHDYLDNAGPTGSIHASITDMTRWVRFQLGDGAFEGKRILTVKTFEETHTPQMVIRLEGNLKTAYPKTVQAAYGLGWIIHDHRGRSLISHTGGLAGFRARIVLVPGEKLGIVFLMNSGVGSSFASMHYVVTNKLLDLLLGLPPEQWDQHYVQGAQKIRDAEQSALREAERLRHRDTRPSRELAAYVGVYEDPAYGQAKIILNDGALFFEWGRWKIPLKHFHYDTFLARQNPAQRDLFSVQLAAFVLRPDGDVGSMNILGREFKRVDK